MFNSLFNSAFGGAFLNREPFVRTYRAHSIALHDNPSLEGGDKIILPESALSALSVMNVAYPMQFEISNAAGTLKTHVGVVEFTAEEGHVFVPYWILSKLGVNDGAGFVIVKNIQLPKASFVKIQPQTTDFIELSNPKAVLEQHLKMFTCLTEGDTICIPYRKKNYFLNIVETKPSKAVCIVETNMEVDFLEPLDYQKVQEERARIAAVRSSPAFQGLKGVAPSPHVRGGSTPGLNGNSPALSSMPALNIGEAMSELSVNGDNEDSSNKGSKPGEKAFPQGGQKLGSSSGGTVKSPEKDMRSILAEAAMRRLANSHPTTSPGTPTAPAETTHGSNTPFESKLGGSSLGGSMSPSPTSSISGLGGTIKTVSTNTPSRTRTLNKFEAARAAKAFQGNGKSLQD